MATAAARFKETMGEVRSLERVIQKNNPLPIDNSIAIRHNFNLSETMDMIQTGPLPDCVRVS